MLIPTLEIELVWVSHILRSRKYYADYKRLGLSPDHSLLLSPSSQLTYPQAVEATARAWKELFTDSEYCSAALLQKPHQFWSPSDREGVVYLAPPSYFPHACSSATSVLLEGCDVSLSARMSQLTANGLGTLPVFGRRAVLAVIRGASSMGMRWAPFQRWLHRTTVTSGCAASTQTNAWAHQWWWISCGTHTSLTRATTWPSPRTNSAFGWTMICGRWARGSRSRCHKQSRGDGSRSLACHTWRTTCTRRTPTRLICSTIDRRLSARKGTCGCVADCCWCFVVCCCVWGWGLTRSRIEKERENSRVAALQ
jgi:hypothetical protein